MLKCITKKMRNEPGRVPGKRRTRRLLPQLINRPTRRGMGLSIPYPVLSTGHSSQALPGHSCRSPKGRSRQAYGPTVSSAAAMETGC